MFSSKLFVYLKASQLLSPQIYTQRQKHILRRTNNSSKCQVGTEKTKTQQATKTPINCQMIAKPESKSKECQPNQFSIKKAADSSKNGAEMKMKALVLKKKEKEVFLCNVPIPNVLKKDEVSVKVKYSGKL